MRKAGVMHLYRTSEWQGGSGLWYCDDLTDLAGISSRWWTPARMLNMPLDEYVTMLVKEFKVDHISYNPKANVLNFSWDSREACRKYQNWINKKARERNFMC